MQNEKTQYCISHPMLIFWLGVLTGALVVGLVFAYKYLSSTEYKAATLLYPATTKTTTTIDTGTKAIGGGGGTGY